MSLISKTSTDALLGACSGKENQLTLNNRLNHSSNPSLLFYTWKKGTGPQDKIDKTGNLSLTGGSTMLISSYHLVLATVKFIGMHPVSL